MGHVPIWVPLPPRLKAALEREKDDLPESEVIKDSPDSPEPLNKKPRLEMEEHQLPEKAKGTAPPFQVGRNWPEPRQLYKSRVQTNAVTPCGR